MDKNKIETLISNFLFVLCGIILVVRHYSGKSFMGFIDDGLIGIWLLIFASQDIFRYFKNKKK